MNSKKRSLLGIFTICFIFVLAGALFAFSISVASETEAVNPTTPEVLATEEALAEDPVSEEAVVEEANEKPSADKPLVAEEPSAENDIAETVGGPLTVLNSAGQLATTDECEWDETSRGYSIIVNDLTFKGNGSEVNCRIRIKDGASIDTLTLDNVMLTYYNAYYSIISLESEGDLTLNIVNRCSIKSPNECVQPIGVYNCQTFEINGDSTSYLSIDAINNSCATLRQTKTFKLNGGISVDAKSHDYIYEASSYSCINCAVESIIFDTTGVVCFSVPDTNFGANAIENDSWFFKIIVNKGFVELHGQSDQEMGSAAICSKSESASIVLSDGVPMVGAVSSSATLAECKEGVTVDYYPSSNYSLSSIDGQPAGTVFIGTPPPEPIPTPTPGGESSETAQTWDSVPSVAIALLAIISLSSFVVLRSRKSNK